MILLLAVKSKFGFPDPSNNESLVFEAKGKAIDHIECGTRNCDEGCKNFRANSDSDMLPS